MKQTFQPPEPPLSEQRRRQEARTAEAQCPGRLCRWYMVRSRGVRKCETCGAVEDDPWSNV